MDKIDSFTGTYRWLSNFESCVVTLDGVEYASVEHAYQAAKLIDPTKREIFTLAFNPELSPAKARRIGQTVELREHWDNQLRREIMRELLIQKFSKPEFRSKLLATKDAELVEGNWWHDIFFGVCLGTQLGRICRHGPHEPVGENVLGQLLMEIRSSLFMQPQQSQSFSSSVEAPVPMLENQPLSKAGE